MSKNESQYELRGPVDTQEWNAFHAIRRRVLFENRGKGETYLENHPDDSRPENHPLILVYQGDTIGVMRLDVAGSFAWLRRLAIREDRQGRGHGRVLLQLAEALARKEGCTEIRTNAAIEAVGFYERCGYRQNFEAAPENSVRFYKDLVEHEEPQGSV